MRKILVTTIALFAATAAVQAQNANGPQGGGQNAEERFKTLDTNKDGKVSQAEYLAGGNVGGNRNGGNNGGNNAGGNNRAERFKNMDANKDGSLSLDEYKTGRSAMGNRQGGGQGGANRS